MGLDDVIVDEQIASPTVNIEISGTDATVSTRMFNAPDLASQSVKNPDMGRLDSSNRDPPDWHPFRATNPPSLAQV